MELFLAALGNIKGEFTLNGEDISVEAANEGSVCAGDFESLSEIIIKPKSGKFADSEDSFIFAYTAIDPSSEDFELSGSFSVQTITETPPGRQSGYGIIAADTVASPDKSCCYRNMIAVGRHRMTNAFETGLGIRAVLGYHSPEANEFENVRKIDSTRVSELSANSHITNNEAFIFTLRKTDEGFSASITDSGGQSDELTFPGCDFLIRQDPSAMYIGFAAARKIIVSVSDIRFTKMPGIISHTPDSAIHPGIPDYPFFRGDIPESSGTTAQILLPQFTYVSPDGKAGSAGTKQEPVDLQTAIKNITHGQKMILEDGTYRIDAPYVLERTCQNSDKQWIEIEAEHPGKAIIDGSLIEKRVPAMILRGNYWHLTGLVFQNSRSAGLLICGSHNLVEHCEALKNHDTGILVCSWPGSAKETWPAYNDIRYCESHDNHDPEEENADGFGAKLSIGEENHFYECIAHHNADDGFDLYSKSIIGPIGAVKLENCLAYENGHCSGQNPRIGSESGIGFKFGGENQPVDHLIIKCAAIDNDGVGFSSNSNPKSCLIDTYAKNNRPDLFRFDYNLMNSRSDVEPGWKLTRIIPRDSIYVNWDRSPEVIEKYFSDETETTHDELAAAKDNKRLMFLVPRLSGGGAEKAIASLASHMAEKHEVWLVTTIRENQQEKYFLSKKVHYINLYTYDKPEQTSAQAVAQKKMIKENRYLRLFRRLRARVSRIKNALVSRFPSNKPEITQTAANPVCVVKPRLTPIEILKELKEKYKIDCAISFLNSANYLNAMSNVGEKTIISIRSYLEGPYAPFDARTTEGKDKIRTACQHADVITVVSEEISDQLTQNPEISREKITVIPNYADIAQIHKKSKETAKDPELISKMEAAKFVFISAGRLTEKKGQWHLIRAFREVVKEHPEAILVILGHEGKGEENTADLLKQIITENHLEDHVFLPGFHLNPFPYFKEADAFVLSSFNEGFPNVIAEALSMGLPVISTDCRSGPREILAPATDYMTKTQTIDHAEYGILVPECSGNKNITGPLESGEMHLAKAMKEIIEDKNLRGHYIIKSMERACHFRKENFLAKWEELISTGGETYRSIPEKEEELRMNENDHTVEEELSEWDYCRKIEEFIPEITLYSNSAHDQLIRIVQKRGLPDIKSYYRLLADNEDEVAFLKQNLTLMGSHFFRGLDWDTLSTKCLPSFTGKDKVRVWCAGCSSGEEVYSVVMALLEYVPIENIEVLATDYNPEMLARCRKGTYGPTHYEEIPEKYRNNLVKINSNFTFKQEIKDRIKTQYLNLLLDEYPQGFDIITCRNVIKFFTPDMIKEVQKKLVNSLNSGGFLFLAVNIEGGNRETIDNPAALHVRQFGQSIYQK